MDKTKIMNSYGPRPLTLVSGSGLRVRDNEGKTYLDFTSGIGVTSIGHAHPQWVAAVSEQAARLGHSSNLYYNEPGIKLANRLAALSELDGAKVFFSNSGAEANEGAIKVARKYSADKYGPHRHEIITLEGSFHGRTLTTLAATGQDKFHQYFHPLTEGFKHVKPNDISALENSISDNTCAIILEVIQGEGGVLPLDDAYVKAARRIATQHDLVLIIDEVQTGIARTGMFFAYMYHDIKPDVVTFAKGIGGGLPLGGVIAAAPYADVLTPGTHATTYGMNPVACAGANAVLDVLVDGGAMSSVAAKGARLSAALATLGLAPRGRGLMLGASLPDASVGNAASMSKAAATSGVAFYGAASGAAAASCVGTSADCASSVASSAGCTAGVHAAAPPVGVASVGIHVGASAAVPAAALTASALVDALRHNGLLALTANTALRLLPALTVSEAEIDEAITVITKTLRNLST